MSIMCPICGIISNLPCSRLVQDSCGHYKCRLCLVDEENGCNLCNISNFSEEREDEIFINVIEESSKNEERSIQNSIQSRTNITEDTPLEFTICNSNDNTQLQINNKESVNKQDIQDNDCLSQKESIENYKLFNEEDVAVNNLIVKEIKNENNVALDNNIALQNENKNAVVDIPVIEIKGINKECFSNDSDKNIQDSKKITEKVAIKETEEKLKEKINKPGPFNESISILNKDLSDKNELDETKSIVQTNSDANEFEEFEDHVVNQHNKINNCSKTIAADLLKVASTNHCILTKNESKENNFSNKGTNEIKFVSIGENNKRTSKVLMTKNHKNINHKVKNNESTTKLISKDKIEHSYSNIYKIVKNVKKEFSKSNNISQTGVVKRKRNADWSHIVVLPGPQEKYQCNICEKVFKNRHGKCYHTACLTGIKPYKCDICNKTFVTRSHYEYHERVHRDYKPFECKECNKKFVLRNKLNRHLLIHESKQKVKCNDCGKDFSRKEYLKNHLKIHDEDKAHKCDLCSRTFGLYSNLKRHQQSHSADRPFSCDVCFKDYKSKFLLTRHKKSHEKDKPFSCNSCGKGFISKCELKRHMIVHSDAKPFCCQFCGTEFRRKDNLNRHIRHHHMMDTLDFSLLAKNDTNRTSEINIHEEFRNCSDPLQKETEKISKKISNNLKKSKTRCNKLFNTKYLASRKGKNTELNSQTLLNEAVTSLNSVIKTTKEANNAVPVIKTPIFIKKIDDGCNRKLLNYTQTIPLAEVIDLNKQIEEKIYQQNTANRSFLFNNYSDLAAENDSYLKKNVDQSVTIDLINTDSLKHTQEDSESNKSHPLHWRRRTAEKLKNTTKND